MNIKSLQNVLSFDPLVPLIIILINEWIQDVTRYLYTRMFTGTFFIIEKKMKNFKCYKRRMITLWHNHMLGYYVAIKNTS